jgi:hypothetical protein
MDSVEGLTLANSNANQIGSLNWINQMPIVKAGWNSTEKIIKFMGAFINSHQLQCTIDNQDTLPVALSIPVDEVIDRAGNTWASDAVLIAMFAIIIGWIYRIWSARVYRKLLQRERKQKNKIDINVDEVKKEAWKRGDAEFHILCYALLWAAGMLCIWNEVASLWSHGFWFPINTSYLWHRESILAAGSRIFYLFQFAFYLQGFVFLLFATNPKRVDHNVFVAHHIVTLFLVGASYALGWTRSGLCIFVLHDLSDMFLHLGKYGKFLESETLAMIAWGMFILTYVLFRLVYFPQIVYSSWTEFDDPTTGHVEKYSFSIALTMLFFMHCIWGVFIAKSVVKSLKNRTLTDARD